MPKPLIPVAGRSLLERSMDRLVAHGVTNIVVNVHHLGRADRRPVGDRVRIVHEERLLETGGSVKNALPLLGSGAFFVINGDGLWREGPRSPMLLRMEGSWDPSRMDALLLLQPIHKVIGREAADRGDYFLEPGGHLRHRGTAQLRLSPSPAFPSAMTACSRESPEGPFSLLRLWNRAEAAQTLVRHRPRRRLVSCRHAPGPRRGRTRAGMKGVFTIGIDRRFADELARGILTEHEGDPLSLADVLVLLPTRRSVRALREAFLRAANGRPTLLPRMAPLGDLEESEWEIGDRRRHGPCPAPGNRTGRTRCDAGSTGRRPSGTTRAIPSPSRRRRR